jgi:hypothetical protein
MVGVGGILETDQGGANGYYVIYMDLIVDLMC